MKREIIHPKGFKFTKSENLSEDDRSRWTEIKDPNTIEALRDLSAELKVASTLNSKK